MRTFREWSLNEGPQGALSQVFSKGDLYHFKGHLYDTMPAGKVQHSFRVGRKLAKAGVDADVIGAGIFHDFLERGGDPNVMMHDLHFSDRVVRLIQALSDGEKNDASVENGPLDHMKAILNSPALPPETKNDIILIKVSDRIDNFKRRVDAGKLGKNYIQKTKDLVKFLFHQYSGNPSAILILRKRLKDLGVTIKKHHLSNLDLSAV